MVFFDSFAVHDILIGLRNNSNQEVQHYDNNHELVHKPKEPNQFLLEYRYFLLLVKVLSSGSLIFTIEFSNTNKNILEKGFKPFLVGGSIPMTLKSMTKKTSNIIKYAVNGPMSLKHVLIRVTNNPN